MTNEHETTEVDENVLVRWLLAISLESDVMEVDGVLILMMFVVEFDEDVLACWS